MLSEPPAITTLSMPAMMLPAALCTAPMPDAQWRLSARPGHLDEAEVDRGVAGDVAAALQRLAHHHVVDVAGRDAGALERLAGRVLGELERGDVEERSLAGGPDRRAGRGNDDSVGHISPWSVFVVRGDYLTPPSGPVGRRPSARRRPNARGPRRTSVRRRRPVRAQRVLRARGPPSTDFAPSASARSCSIALSTPLERTCSQMRTTNAAIARQPNGTSDVGHGLAVAAVGDLRAGDRRAPDQREPRDEHRERLELRGDVGGRAPVVAGEAARARRGWAGSSSGRSRASRTPPRDLERLQVEAPLRPRPRCRCRSAVRHSSTVPGA